MNPLTDLTFLKALDEERVKEKYVKILVLDRDERPIQSIEGRVSSGSISVDGSSAMRRAADLVFIADESKNDLTDIDNLLSMNKRVQLFIGIKNNINPDYDDIIWFKQGVFVIVAPTITHSLSGVNISLQLKDKMCLLNGEMGGGLPTSITFDSYDQIVGLTEIDYAPEESQTAEDALYLALPQNCNGYTIYGMYNTKDDTRAYYYWDTFEGWQVIKDETSIQERLKQVVSVKQRIYDIILTLVCNYGFEPIENILIEDVPLQIKQIVRYVGTAPLYVSQDGIYTTDSNKLSNENSWAVMEYNEECGHVYTDFVYPGSLVSSLGENVCSVLEKIASTVGNYEFFYDVDGKFIFREKKNYLNSQYVPVQKRLWQDDLHAHNLSDLGYLLNENNYYVDFSNRSSDAYTFDEGSNMIISYSNTPNYMNIKNDFHIWGKNSDDLAIHYHAVIKEKPTQFHTYLVEPLADGRIKLLDNNDISDSAVSLAFDQDKFYIIDPLGETSFKQDADFEEYLELRSAAFVGMEDGVLITKPGGSAIKYTPTDWRAELYMRGLEKQRLHLRPDIYEQELLDKFDIIYNMQEQKFKEDISNRTNNLTYWLDFIEPVGKLGQISVDSVGSKISVEQNDKIKRLYNADIPNFILVNLGAPLEDTSKVIARCKKEGQPFANISQDIYNAIAIGAASITSQEAMRNKVYTETSYLESVSITTVPIYYLEPNTRIKVLDSPCGISGEYIINSFTLPLDVGTSMTISASRALERI